MLLTSDLHAKLDALLKRTEEITKKLKYVPDHSKEQTAISFLEKLKEKVASSVLFKKELRQKSLKNLNKAKKEVVADFSFLQKSYSSLHKKLFKEQQKLKEAVFT